MICCKIWQISSANKSLQLLFDEKIITEREGNLILATASDDVLGEDAAIIRSRILRSLLLRLDREGN